MANSISRKAQITREEFMRQLPDAAGFMGHSVDGNDIVIGNGGQRVHIHLTDLGIEDKGALELPMQKVDFNFENMSDEDADQFMGHWDQHKLRMGG